MWNLLIIDDHPLVVDGIRTMLHDLDFIAVKGAVKTAKEALELLASDPSFDLILLDLNLPDLDGLQLCEYIRRDYKKPKILGLSYVNEAGITTQLLKAGAQGFLLKSMDRDELIKAIGIVMEGKTYITAEASSKIIEEMRKSVVSGEEIPLLTRREREILTLLTDGLKSSQIADKLFLSPHTVDTHRKNMLQKFGAHNTQGLLKKVSELGLLK